MALLEPSIWAGGGSCVVLNLCSISQGDRFGQYRCLVISMLTCTQPDPGRFHRLSGEGALAQSDELMAGQELPLLHTRH